MDASRYVTFPIPVHPVVEKYLSFHYDTAPFGLSGTGNMCSTYLYNALSRYGHYDTGVPKRYGKLTASLLVGVPTWVAQRGHGAKLTPAKIGAFNAFVQARFYEAMTVEIALRMARGQGLVEATRLFLGRYGITEDELSLLKALRYYARYSEKMLPKLVDDCHSPNGSPGVTL